MGVRDLARDLVDAYNDKDAEAFGSLFTDDAQFVNVLGDRRRGRVEIAESHRHAFTTVLAGTSLSAEGLDVEALGNDLEVGVLEWRRDRAADAPPVGAPAGTGVFTLVARRDGDRWRLAAASNVPVTQPPGAPPLR
jgi:uncharacterized protein (TIGR02246 family)